MPDSSKTGDILIKTMTVGDIDLLQLAAAVIIHEDIFSNFFIGQIGVSDPFGRFHEIATGEAHKVIIEWKTISNEIASNYTKIEGYLTKISSVTFPKQGIMEYTLHFSAKEYITNEISRFSTVLSGSISEILRDVCKRIDIEPTTMIDCDKEQKHKIVVPYWTPFYTINKICSLAKSSKNEAVNYLFYQTIDGNYHFTSLDSIIDKGDNSSVVETFKIGSPAYNPPGDSIPDNISYGVLNSIGFESGLDVLNTVIDNGVSGKIWTHDLIRNRVNEYRFDYESFYGNTNHLSKDQIVTDLGDIDLADKDNPVNYRLYPASKGLFDGYYDDVNSEGRYSNRWAIQRKSSILGQWYNKKVRCSVSGDSKRRVGDIVTLNIPKEMTGDSITKNEDYSGKYLVSTVVHVFDLKSYSAFVELIRD